MPTDVNFQIPFNPGLQIGEQVLQGLHAGFQDNLDRQKQQQVFQIQQREADIRQQIADHDKVEKEASANRDNALADEARMGKLSKLNELVRNENQKRQFLNQPPVSLQDYLRQNDIDEHGNLGPTYSINPKPIAPSTSYQFHEAVPQQFQDYFNAQHPEWQRGVASLSQGLVAPVPAKQAPAQAPPPLASLASTAKRWMLPADFTDQQRAAFNGLSPADQETIAGQRGIQTAPDWTKGLSDTATSAASFVEQVGGTYAPEDKRALARVIEANLNGNPQKIRDYIETLAAKYTDPKELTYAQFRNQGMSEADATQARDKAFRKPTPAKVGYDQGIPVSVTDTDGTTYDIHDPELPQNLKGLAASANAAHLQRIREAASSKDESRQFKSSDSVIGYDENGKEVLTNASDAKDLELTDLTKADANSINQTNKARQYIKLSQKIQDEIGTLDKGGKLGPLAGRWNDFLAGKYGAGDPDYQKLKTDMGLAETLLMNVHVGSRGGSYLLEHFHDLAAADKMDAPTLKAGIQAEYDYALDKAALPPSLAKKMGIKGSGKSADPAGIF